MTSANVHEAKTNLSKLLNAAAEGDEVIITRRGGGKVTKFKLLPIQQHKKSRLFGALKGKIIFAADYDDADKEIRDMFNESLGK